MESSHTTRPNHALQRTRPLLVTTNHSGEAIEKLLSKTLPRR